MLTGPARYAIIDQMPTVTEFRALRKQLEDLSYTGEYVSLPIHPDSVLGQELAKEDGMTLSEVIENVLSSERTHAPAQKDL